MEMQDYEVKGIIEIGSRGIRILVAERRGESIHYIFSSGRQLNLGFYEDDVLPNKEKLQQAVDLVIEFRRIIKTFAASDMIIATEIMRNPRVLQEFMELMKLKIDDSASVPPIVVLDKKIEAYFAFSSVIKHFKRDFRKPVLVIDMGGGSTEFAVGRSTNRNPEILFTLSEKEISSLKFYRSMQNSIDKTSTWQEIQRFLDVKITEIYNKFKEHKPVELIAMGSSAIDLSRMQIELSTGEECTSSSTGLTEIEISSKFIKRFINQTFDESLEEKEFRMQFGMYFFSRILDVLELPVLSICGHGLRYSIIQDWLLGRFDPK